MLIGRDRGTVLLLFPTAVLVMFVLGAIVVDVGLTQLRGRELESVAASAANDALAALDVEALRAGDGVVIDRTAARAIVTSSIEAGVLPGARIADISVTRDGANRAVIAVTLTLDVDLVMAPAVGELTEITLQRTERAVILGSELT